MKKIILYGFSVLAVLILTLTLTACDNPTSSEGGWDGVTTDGSWYGDDSADTFEISTPEQLAALAKFVNLGNNFATKTIIQTENINLGGKQWTPIGTNGNPFEGIYAATPGKTISGLKITGAEDYQGLFGNISGAGQVTNVTLKGVSISGSNYVGGVTGRNNSTVTGCSVTGSVTGVDRVGGIAGSNNIWVTECTYTGSVKGRQYVGGIAGINIGASAKVERCSAAGSVTGTYNYVGGIVGDNNGAGATVVRCSAAGSVTGENYAGGIAGRSANGSFIANCYATANVKVIINGYAGGIVGSLPSGNTVKYCYATGSVEGYYARGISNSSGSTEYSVALNTSITGTSKARVCNTNGKNNYARSNMPGGTMPEGDTWNNKGPDNPDGEDVSPGTAATQYNNQAWWTTAANWDGAPWDFDDIWKMSNGNNPGSLPILQ